jgi:TonB family protein
VPVRPTVFYSVPFHLPDDAVRALSLTGDGPVEVVRPTYPIAAKKAGVHGTVLLEVVVAENGAIEKATAISGPPMLRKVAVDAVRQWRYKPLIRDGKPAKRDTTVAVRFVLPKGKKTLADKN